MRYFKQQITTACIYIMSPTLIKMGLFANTEKFYGLLLLLFLTFACPNETRNSATGDFQRNDSQEVSDSHVRKFVKFESERLGDPLESEDTKPLPATLLTEDVSTDLNRGSVVDYTKESSAPRDDIRHIGESPYHPAREKFPFLEDNLDKNTDQNRDAESHDSHTNIFTSPKSTSQHQPVSSSAQNHMTSSQTQEEEEYFDDRQEEDDPDLPVEQRLMRSLLRNYERSVRPVKNATDTVIVKMGLTLTQIFDMDEKNQVLVTNVWLDQEWGDMFLKWDPADYGGLQTLRLPCHKIWLPDIVLYNNAAQYTDGLMPANAMITSEGNVFWPVPTKLQSTCKVDVTYFPFDDQTCKLKFGSWTYDGFQVNMFNRTQEVDLSNYVSNGEWELISIEIVRNVVYYGCCPEPFPDVTFFVHIRRRILYYLYNVIFPCIMMSALTLLVFCLPPESGEKVTLGITVLLAFSVFMLTVAEDLPETSEFIPLLSIYLTIVMAMTSVSVIMTVFVLNLHYRSPDNKPVPKWLRRCFVKRARRGGLAFKQKHPYFEEVYTDDQSNCVRNVPWRLTIENLAQELKEELDTGETPPPCEIPVNEALNSRAPPRFDPPGYREVTQGNSARVRYVTNSNPVPPRTSSSPSFSKTGDILCALRKIIERYERDDTEEAMLYEWRQVALGVDRILFWIFLVGTLGSTILVLIVLPITKVL